MRPIARNLHVVIAIAFVVGLAVQVWLAGRGVFESETVFATHREFGYGLSALPIALLVLGLLGGMGRRIAIMAVALFVLFILQSVFVAFKGTPAIAALHPVNGFLIVLLAVWLARDSWGMRTATV